MTETPYILWAVLATGGAVADYIFMRRKCRALAERTGKLASELATARGFRDAWCSIATSLQNKLSEDAAKRSSITSRGNRTRAANRRAKVLEQASKLVAPKVDRIAA